MKHVCLSDASVISKAIQLVSVLLPVCKDGIIFKHISPSCRFLLLLFSGSRICKLSNDADQRSREINFELLFKACSKPEDAKCVHTLLIVAGKTKSTFVSTRLINIYVYLGNVSLYRKTFDHKNSGCEVPDLFTVQFLL
ncbi:hypothetical protein ACS0TY_009120 [Phlomoides rotata]